MASVPPQSHSERVGRALTTAPLRGSLFSPCGQSRESLLLVVPANGLGWVPGASQGPPGRGCCWKVCTRSTGRHGPGGGTSGAGAERGPCSIPSSHLPGVSNQDPRICPPWLPSCVFSFKVFGASLVTFKKVSFISSHCLYTTEWVGVTKACLDDSCPAHSED